MSKYYLSREVLGGVLGEFRSNYGRRGLVILMGIVIVGFVGIYIADPLDRWIEKRRQKKK